MNVLIACEESGRIRDAMIKAGHNVWSCDLLPGRGHNVHRHIQDDIRTVLNGRAYELRNGMLIYPEYWHMLIAHPDCTYLTNSAEWAYSDRPMINGKRRKLKPGTLIGAERREARRDAVVFVKWLAGQPIEHIAIENPVGCLSRYWRKPDQYIQPYEYGHDASKKTCLWLKNLPRLVPTKKIEGRIVNGNRRWANQTDSGQNRETPSEHRAQDRAETYQGWANAMVEQWLGNWKITKRGSLHADQKRNN